MPENTQDQENPYINQHSFMEDGRSTHKSYFRGYTYTPIQMPPEAHHTPTQESKKAENEKTP